MRVKHLAGAVAVAVALVVLLTTGWVEARECEEGIQGTTVLFINGGWVNEEETVAARVKLQNALNAFASTRAIGDGCLRYDHFYVTSDSAIGDLLEAVRLRLRVDDDIFIDLLTLSVTLPLRGLAAVVAQGLRTQFAGLYRDAVIEYNPATDPQFGPNLDELVAQLRRIVRNEGDRVILVPHSEGNFYGNQGYGRMASEGEAESLDLVGVAVPDSGVAGSSGVEDRYVTLEEDLVIKAVRAILPSTLPPNASNGVGVYLADLTGHTFATSYLFGFGSDSEQKIMEAIERAIERTPLPPVPPVASVTVAGGTYVDLNAGLIGTGFLFNPSTPAGVIPFVDITGPPGWNAGNPLSCFRYQPPGTASSRSLCWNVNIPPVTGNYQGQATVDTTPLFADFSIDASIQLPAPEITNLITGSTTVTVDWTATAAARSFLVRANPLPFTGVITGEKVVSGATRSTTLTGLALTPGAQYQAVVFAFSQDVMTPDSLVGPFNIGAHGVVFTAPAAAPMPTARAWLASTQVTGEMFTAGGGEGCAGCSPSFGGGRTDRMESFDPGSTQWQSRTPLLTARFGLAVAEVNGKVYAFGGRGPSSIGDPEPSVEEYDPGTDAWSVKSAMPTPRWKLTAAALNGRIYTIGGGATGNDCTQTGIAEEYNPVTNTWAPRASLPTPRWGLASAVIANEIYVIGGSRLCPIIQVNPSPALEVYDPLTDSWSARPPMPTPRWDHAAASVGGKLYAIGGWDPITETVLETVEEFDPATNAWTTRAPMPTPRTGLVATVVNGKIYAFGGFDGSNVVNIMEVFDPATNTWSTLGP